MNSVLGEAEEAEPALLEPSGHSGELVHFFEVSLEKWENRIWGGKKSEKGGFLAETSALSSAALLF